MDIDTFLRGVSLISSPNTIPNNKEDKHKNNYYNGGQYLMVVIYY